MAPSSEPLPPLVAKESRVTEPKPEPEPVADMREVVLITEAMPLPLSEPSESACVTRFQGDVSLRPPGDEPRSVALMVYVGMAVGVDVPTDWRSFSACSDAIAAEATASAAASLLGGESTCEPVSPVSPEIGMGDDDAEGDDEGAGIGCAAGALRFGSCPLSALAR